MVVGPKLYCFAVTLENERFSDLMYCKKPMSHPVLRPNQMLIVCVPRNQVYTHTMHKMNTE
jgi:hypothetical protein